MNTLIEWCKTNIINIKTKSYILKVSLKWKTDLFFSEKHYGHFKKHYKPQKKNERTTRVHVSQSLFILSFHILSFVGNKMLKIIAPDIPLISESFLPWLFPYIKWWVSVAYGTISENNRSRRVIKFDNQKP